MTASTPSLPPVPAGTGSSDASDPAAAAPRADDAGLRFDDLCPDQSVVHRCGGRRAGKDAPSGGNKAPTESGTNPTEAPTADETVADVPADATKVRAPDDATDSDPAKAVSADDADAVDGDPLVITIPLGDWKNPAQWVAGITDAIARQMDGGRSGELTIVLQAPDAVESAKAVHLHWAGQRIGSAGRGDAPAMAATVATIVQAALTYAKNSDVAANSSANGSTNVSANVSTGASAPGSSAKAAKPDGAASPVAVTLTVSGVEKSAVAASQPSSPVRDAAAKNFLATGNQYVEKRLSGAGIDSALSEDAMNSAPKKSHHRQAPPRAEQRATPVLSPVAAEQKTFSNWKGWTNGGGGDHASTAAQFSHMAERVAESMAGQATTAAASAQAPATTATSSVAPAAPVAPPFPISDAALLGPLGNAVERMVLRGKDQLSLTIRFEQGGSLSLRLALQDGEIKTNIRTDLAGLESAIRSAWTIFSQDWNGRGVKLAAPVFSSSPDMTPDHHQPPTDKEKHGSEDGESTSARFSLQSRAKGAPKNGRRSAATIPTTPAPDASNRGLDVWA